MSVEEILQNELSSEQTVGKVILEKPKSNFKFFNESFNKTIDDYDNNPITLLLNKFFHIFDNRLIPYTIDYFLPSFEGGKSFDLTKILRHPLFLIVVEFVDIMSKKVQKNEQQVIITQ